MYFNLDMFYKSLAADQLLEELQKKINAERNKLEKCELEEVTFHRGKLKAWKELIGEIEIVRKKKDVEEN